MSNMYRKPVKSSNILSIGYDDDELILEIEFKNNGYPNESSRVRKGI
ncbi:KTSC domain-containing protein [Empedobacter falsenii]